MGPRKEATMYSIESAGPLSRSSFPGRVPVMAALALALAAAVPKAQLAFTKADSGWAPIFNGTNFDGLYSRMYGKDVTDIPNKSFSIQDGMIRVTQGSGWEEGHLGTDRKYSHYRARVEYKFDGTDGNAGFTYHTDESVPRMANNWPRSIECQMMQGNAGRAYSIAMATFDTRARNGRYDPAGTQVTACERSPCNARDYGASVILDKRGQWNRMEVVVRGSDSALHRVNDSTVMCVTNIRIPTAQGATTFQPYGSGSLAVQAEGANLVYRNWEIMELHPEGPNHVQRLFLATPGKDAKLAAGSAYNITWRTLGEVKKVSIHYRIGDGNWEVAANNVDNTGSFTWTVPQKSTQELRMKISAAAAWVRADSSLGDLEITGSSGITRPLIGNWASELTGSDGRPARRDLTGRLQGRSAGKAHRILVHLP